jgi:hypothetical protein
MEVVGNARTHTYTHTHPQTHPQTHTTHTHTQTHTHTLDAQKVPVASRRTLQSFLRTIGASPGPSLIDGPNNGVIDSRSTYHELESPSTV